MARDPILVRVYHASYRAFQRAFALASACHTGVWLSILSEPRRFAIDRVYYDGETMYRTAEYNKRGLWEWEALAIDRYFAGCRRVAVVSAGGGREVLALLRRGVQVSGWECHPGLVEFANELLISEGYKSSVRQAPRDQCPPIDAGCDGAIVGWGAYMLIRGSARRVDFLQQLRARLEPGAPVFLSFVMRPRSRRFGIAARLGNLLRRFTGGERLEVGDYLVPNFVHMFTRREVIREFAAAGYDVAAFYASPYGHAVVLPREHSADITILAGASADSVATA